INGGSSTVPDTLPAKLSDREFWKMITGFSEDDGYFRSDNFLSNETGYQFAIPMMRKTIRTGGAYLGVGPEQNFTYIVALEPKMAFVVDIRRQNMLEHLLYKALMELSADRVEFLSRLMSRSRPKSLGTDSSPDAIVRAFEGIHADPEFFDENLRLVLGYLEEKKGFELSSEDEERIR